MSEIDVEAEIENMFATTDDENGTAVKNEPPTEVKNEPRPDSGLRRSSRAPKKKSYREEFEYDEAPNSSHSNGFGEISPTKKVRTSLDSIAIKNEQGDSEIEVLNDDESDDDYSENSEPEKKKGKSKKTKKATAANKLAVKKPTKKQSKKTESLSESDEDFEKTAKKKSSKTTSQPYKCNTQSSEYFMKGDVMWYIAIRREPPTRSCQRGIKKLEINELSNLPKDEIIVMELRVALEDTACKESYKKFATKCVAVGKPKAKGAITGHELLHEYSDSDENLKKIIKIFENQMKEKPNPSCKVIFSESEDQRKLYQRVLDKISDISQHFEYLTGVKTIPEEDNNNEVSMSNFDSEMDPDESFNIGHNESVQIIEVVNANGKSSATTSSVTPSAATPFPIPGTSASESTPSRWDYLKKEIRSQDVINFFEEDLSLKGFWSSLMNGTKKCERHDVCLTDRDRSFTSKISSLTNLNFLNENIPGEDKYITTSIILNRYRQDSRVVSDHPELGKLSEDMQKRYFELVLTPEGIQFYLRQKYDLSEKDAEQAYDEVKHIDEDEEDFPPVQNNKPPTPPRSEEQESDNDAEDLIPDFDSDTG